MKTSVKYIIANYKEMHDDKLVSEFKRFNEKIQVVDKRSKKDLSMLKSVFSIYLNLYEITKEIKKRTGMVDSDFPVKEVENNRPVFNFNIN